MSPKSLMIKVLFPIILSFGISSAGLAQGDWTASLQIDPYPSPYLSDWESNPAIGQATILNNSEETVSVRIHVSISRSGSGTIASGNSQVFEFPPGSSENLDMTELIDFESFDYDHDLEETALRTGRLSEGDYEACIRIEDVGGGMLLDNICASFTTIYPDPPFLSYPFNGDSIDTEYPTFQWLPIQVPVGFIVYYNIKIVEVFQGQIPSQALAANFPHYENTDMTGTGLQYPLDALPFEEGKTYAWQIQALDQNDYPPSSNDGKSEIWTFIFRSGDEPPTHLPPPPPPQGDITINITHLNSAGGIFQQLFTAPFDSIMAVLNAQGGSGEIEIPLPIPNLDVFPDISVPNGSLEIGDNLFTIAGQSTLDERQVAVEFRGASGSEGGSNTYEFRINIPNNLSFSELIHLCEAYFPELGELPFDFNSVQPSFNLGMDRDSINLGISGGFNIGQLTGTSEISIQFTPEGPAFDFSLGDFSDNVNMADVIAAADSLLADWSPTTGPATEWIDTFNFDLNDLNLDLEFVTDRIAIDISGAFDTGDLEGRAGFVFIRDNEESSSSGYIEITLTDIELPEAITLADSLFPGNWNPPIGPAMDWLESLDLGFPQATFSLSFGDDHFGIGLSGIFTADQRSGTASMEFTQLGQQTTLSFTGSFDDDESFAFSDVFGLFPDVQPVSFDMPWLESLTINGPELNVLLTSDSLVAGISGAFASDQRSGTAGLIYTSAGAEPSVRATVTFNQETSFALADMIDLLPASWPTPGGEVFDWLGSLGLSIPGITLQVILDQDCANVEIFGPFALAGQPGTVRLGFEYCGQGLAVSGGLRLETQEITYSEAMAMADSLLPNWTPPSGPVFQKIESLGLSLPSAVIDLSFSIDSLQLGLSGPFRFGSGDDEQEGTSDIKMVRSQGTSSLLGGLNLNLSSIDLPAIMNTISNLLPDGWTLPSGPAIDRLQSLNLNFLQGASLGMHFNPSGWIDFDLLGPFHFGGGDQEDNAGESELELVQGDDGYSLGGALNFSLPEVDMAGVMNLVSNLLPADWSSSSLPSIDWLNSFSFSFDHPTLNIAFPQNGFNINFNGPFVLGQNNNRQGNTFFTYLYTGQINQFSGGLNFNLENIDFPSLISMADSMFGGRWAPPSGPIMNMIQSMNLSFPSVVLVLGFNSDSTQVGIDGSFVVGEQQGTADLKLTRTSGETSIEGGFSLLMHNIDYPRIMALADSLLPDNWSPPSGPAAEAIESLDLSFPEASLAVSFSSDNFNIGVSGSFVIGQRQGTVRMVFYTTNAGSSVMFTGSFGSNAMFSLADLTSMFSPGQLSHQMDWLQSIQISGPTLRILADPDSVRASVTGAFNLNEKPGTAELAVSSNGQVGVLAFYGAFNNNVAFSFADILALLPGDMASLEPPVSIDLTAPELAVVISAESFSARISGNLAIAGRTGSASLTFSYENDGPSLVFNGTVDHFSSNNMIDFIQNQTGVSGFGENLPEDLLEFNDLIITIGVGANNRFSIAANSSFMSQETSLLISVIKRVGHSPTAVVGLRPTDWSISEAFPELSSPIIDELDLSTLGLIFSQGSDTLESSELSPEERQFYGGIMGTGDFSLKLNSGAKLIGTVLPSSFNPDGPMAKILEVLGGGDEGLFLEGSLPLGFGRGGGGLDGLSLSLSLPPMAPPNSPEWFVSGNVALEIAVNPISVALVGGVTVIIDEQALTFFVSGMISISGPNIAFTLSGGLEAEEPWEQPFGIEWLTFNRTIVMVGVNAMGNISLGFRADMVVGEKDIDVAVVVVVNVSGVPVNFVIQGESEAGFGMSDLVDLQHKMATVRALAEGQPAPPMLPIEQLPAIDIKECFLKFAPRDEPALEITMGMAIAGELYITPPSGGEPNNFAGVDMGIGDLRIYAAGHIGAFGLGPVNWDDALFDLNLELGASHLMIDGQATLLGNSQQVQVNMSRDSLFFHTQTHLDNRFLVDLAARGVLNLTNPSFEVHGVMQSEFNGQFGQVVSDGISTYVGAADQVITAALEAYDQVAALHAHKQEAIDSLTILLNAIRAVVQNEVDQAQSLKEQAHSEKVIANNEKNSAYNTWQNTPRLQAALRAQRHVAYVAKVAVYNVKAAIYAASQANFLAKQAVLNAIPSPETDPLLVILVEATDQLWAEMQQRQQDLLALQTIVRQIQDYMNQIGGPIFSIQGAEFNANLDDLVQGNGVMLGFDFSMAGEPGHADINLSFANAEEALQPLLASFFGNN